MRILVNILILFLLLPVNGRSQCSIQQSVEILDNQTVLTSILVSGVTNDDLGSPGQGICGIEMEFDHFFIGDVEINLTSPAGQQITLLGPSSLNSGITQFTNWDITMVPCGDFADPDIGYNEIWNNLQLWGSFGSYSGSYYPHDGCLEDFNMGSINGSWIIEIIDASVFGAGNLIDFTLILCDETGSDCGGCEANAGVITSVDTIFCAGDPALMMDVEVDFQGSVPEEEDYIYAYYIFENDSIVALDVEVDLTSFEGGVYEVCGISAFGGDTLNLISSGAFSNEDLNFFYESQLICAHVSTECMEVTIVPVTDSIYISESICLGDTFFINGLELTEADLYVVDYTGAFCDSVTILDLDVLDMEARISEDIDVLTCLQKEVSLSGINSQISQGATFSWTTPDGSIISNPDSVEILVDQPGLYILDVINGNCVVSDSATVLNDESFPALFFLSDTLNCTIDSTMITMFSSIPLISAEWTSDNTFNQAGNNIMVGDTGVYNVSVIANNGCPSESTVTVIGDFELPEASLSTDILSCTNEEVMINSELDMDGLTSISWSGPGPFFADTLNPIVTEAGIYTLNVVGENTCEDNFQIEVQDTSTFAVVNVTSGIIDCTIESLDIAATSSVPLSTYIWTGPNFTAFGSAVTITEAGDYFVTVTTPAGCETTASTNIVGDTTLSPIQAIGNVIYCADDSVQLSVSSMDPNVTFQWTGPIDFMSTSEMPFVSIVGDYYVEGINQDGCITYDTVSLVRGPDLPDIVFVIDTLDCLTDSFVISPSVSTGYSFIWTGTGISDPNISNPTITEGGIKSCLITDLQTGCDEAYFFDIVERNEAHDLIYEIEELNCVIDSVQINYTLEGQIIDIVWAGPNQFESDEMMPFVYEPGMYIATYTDEGGCIGIDTAIVDIDLALPTVAENEFIIGCGVDSILISTSTNNFGSTFVWNVDGEIKTGISVYVYSSGMYEVEVTGPNGCTNTGFATVVNDFDGPSLSLSSSGSLLCVGGDQTLSFTSDETIVSQTWIDSNDVILSTDPTLMVSEEGWYYVEAMNNLGCFSRDSIFQISEQGELVYSIDNSNLDCDSNSAVISISTPTNDESVIWDGPEPITPGELNPEVSMTGIYYFTLTNSAGCSAMDSVEITVDTLKPSLIINPFDSLTCINSEVSLFVSSGILVESYEWTGPQIEQTELPSQTVEVPGIYTVEITGINGCSSIAEMEVIMDVDSPQFTAMGDTLTCLNSKGILFAEVTEPYDSLLWTANNYSSTDPISLTLQPGFYNLEVVGLNGCVSDTIVEVYNTIDTLNLSVEDQYLRCDDEPITLIAETTETQVSFEWFGPDEYYADTQFPTTTEEGMYIVYISSDTSMCRNFDTIMVIDEPVYPEYTAIAGFLGCNGFPVPLIGGNLYDDESYFWIGEDGVPINDSIAMVNALGFYTLHVVGENGCVDSVELEVIEDSTPPDLNVHGDSLFQCSNTTVTIAANASTTSGQSVYSWTSATGQIISDPNLDSITIDGEGLYIVEVTDPLNQCTSKDSLNMILTQDLEALFVSRFNPTCFGFDDGSIKIDSIIGGHGPFEFSLNNSDFVPQYAFEPLEPGDYVVTVKDSLGCLETDSITIQEATAISVSLPEDMEINLGDTIFVRGETNIVDFFIDTIIWTTSINLDCDQCLEHYLVPLESTSISLYIENLNGCFDSDEMFIRVKDDPILGMPNIFNPNSVSGNNIFYIPHTRGISRIVDLSIHDRWGGLVFHNKDYQPGDPSYGWNGQLNGKDVQPGVFVVIVEVELINGNRVKYTGDLTLIR